MWNLPKDDSGQKNAGAKTAAPATREQLQAASRRVLWPLVAFLALSIWARSGFRFLPPLPDDWKSWMGAPPSPSLINALFVLYLLSALILSLLRMADNARPDPAFRPIGYLAVFYGFHFVAGSLQDNFFVVLIGGAVLLSLECHRNLRFYRQKLQDL